VELRRGHLLYFVTVAEEGSITRAAERLHVSQPTLSQALSLLESDLGLALLERHGRGVRLTPDGDAFAAKARTALAAWDDALAVGRSQAPERRDTIVFGFLGIPPGLDSPVPLERFLRAYPDVDLRYRELPFPTVPTASWLGDVDVAVCHRPPADAGVWSHLVRSEPRVAIMRDGHPLAARAEVSFAELRDETFIGMHPAVERSWAGFWSLDDHRGAPPATSTPDAAANPQEVLAALAMREAVTTVPAPVAPVIASAQAGLVAVPVSDAVPAQITLVGHKASHNPCVAALLAFARSVELRS
jgi:DNA-binding transcriptional LysR family regulator